MERNLMNELEAQLNADAKASEKHIREEEDEMLNRIQQEIDELKDAQKESNKKYI